jgi:hypothetical protein
MTGEIGKTKETAKMTSKLGLIDMAMKQIDPDDEVLALAS